MGWDKIERDIDAIKEPENLVKIRPVPSSNRRKLR